MVPCSRRARPTWIWSPSPPHSWLVTRGRQRLACLDDPLQRLRTRDVRRRADGHVRHAYRLHLTHRLYPRLRSSWPCDQPPGHAAARRVAASLSQVAVQPRQRLHRIDLRQPAIRHPRHPSQQRLLRRTADPDWYRLLRELVQSDTAQFVEAPLEGHEGLRPQPSQHHDLLLQPPPTCLEVLS